MRKRGRPRKRKRTCMQETDESLTRKECTQCHCLLSSFRPFNKFRKSSKFITIDRVMHILRVNKSTINPSGRISLTRLTEQMHRYNFDGILHELQILYFLLKRQSLGFFKLIHDDSNLHYVEFLRYTFTPQRNLFNHGLCEESWFNEELYRRGSISFHRECEHCTAYLFAHESNSFCCRNGKLNLLPTPNYDCDLQRSLFEGTHPHAGRFLEKIRIYNACFSMASLCCKRLALKSRGPPIFAAHGSIYHYYNTQLFENDPGSGWLQSMIYDPLFKRASFRTNFGLTTPADKQLIHEIHQSLLQRNHLLSLLKTNLEKAKEHNADEVDIILKSGQNSPDHHGSYDRPTSNDIAVLVCGERGKNVGQAASDIVITLKSNLRPTSDYNDNVSSLIRETGIHDFLADTTDDDRPLSLARISDAHPFRDALCYPLLHWSGNKTWSPKMTHNGIHVSKREYYRYLLIRRRKNDNIVLKAKRLTQVFVCDAYASTDQWAASYFYKNQRRIHSVRYNVYQKWYAERSSAELGAPVILPGTHTLSPRWYYKKCQEAMAAVLAMGKPDLFITLTGNPSWPEITQNLPANTPVNDAPQLVCRVFQGKIKYLLNLITIQRIFGPIEGYIYTVEFQKRGLPHIHMLLKFKAGNRVRTASQLSQLVWAEIPDPVKYPRLHKLVLRHHVHSDCSTNADKFVCRDTRNGRCRFRFPRDFSTNTHFQNGSYPVYRRLPPELGGHTGRIKSRIVNNQWVSPYNPLLLLLMECHCFVEYNTSIDSTKYILKYVYKGTDMQNYGIVDSRCSTNEIQEYINSRCITPYLACWYLFKYDFHHKQPSVMVLDLHLPNENYVLFDADSSTESIASQVDRQLITSLTGWMEFNTKYNVTNEKNDASIKSPTQLTYVEFPKYYRWENKRWVMRLQTRKVIGYLPTPKQSSSSLFFLHLLLRCVPFARNWVDLRTFPRVVENPGIMVDPIVHNSFKDACLARGLLNDNEYITLLLSASIVTHNPAQSLELFTTLLICNNGMDFSELWIFVRNHLSGIRPHWSVHRRQFAYDLSLTRIQQSLASCNLVLEEFNLPVPNELKNVPFAMREHHFAPDQIKDFDSRFCHLFESLNSEQNALFHRIIRDECDLCWLNAAGGCGKTHLARTLLYYYRARRKIVVTIASTGLAATLLPTGKTVHSAFKLGPWLSDETSSPISEYTHKDLWQLYSECTLLIWDEAAMSSRMLFECVDRTLRRIRVNDKPFGGCKVFLMGDFRQTSVIVPKSTKSMILANSLISSSVWLNCFEKHTLKTNMRIKVSSQSDIPISTNDSKDWANYLLTVGSFASDDRNSRTRDRFYIDNDLVSHASELRSFVEHAFPRFADNYSNPSYLCERTLLTPLNKHVDEVNDLLYDIIPTAHERIFFSTNILNDDVDGSIWTIPKIEMTDWTGLPPHILKLKPRQCVMCLRNINPSIGLVNGARLIIDYFEAHYITATLINNGRLGRQVSIPRIPFQTDLNQHGVCFKRIQFPLRACYAMTINKAQGQTIPHLALHLPNPCFAHGQLYTALSRCGVKKNVSIFIESGPLQGSINVDDEIHYYTQNIVYPELIKYT